MVIVSSHAQNRDLLTAKVVIDQYHNQNIEDPYRYVENLSNPEVKEWIDTQNKISHSFLNGIEKRQFLINKQIELDQKNEFVVSKLTVTNNDHYFYLKRLPSENVAKLYHRTSFSNEEVLLYDPISFFPSENKEFLINYFQPDWEGAKIAISLTEKGKELSRIIILDTKTKLVSKEVLKNTWPSNDKGIEWIPDNSGFVYVQYPNAEDPTKNFLFNSTSLFHKVGERQTQDTPVFSKSFCPNLNLKKEDFPITSIEDPYSDYIVAAAAGAGAYNDAYYLPIKDIGSNNWTLLFSKNEQIKNYTIIGDSIVFKTSKNAPNFKIGITSIKNPNYETARILVKEKDDEVITDFAIMKDGLFYVSSKNGVQAKLFKQAQLIDKEIKLPKTFGNITISSKGKTDHKLNITAKGWTTNSERYEYENDTIVSKNIHTSSTANILDDIVIEEIEVTGHDGQKIPLSIFYHKDMVKNGKNQVLMDGYGSYGISMKPAMRIHRTLWLLEGGIYAIAHVRGGGEKGSSWHKGGYKSSKPNTWKDFISCAEYLITNQYTSQKNLAVLSGSAGGILIGRAITERPDLFAAAIIEFGSLNMLRSEMRRNGANNIKEFGTIKDPEDFKSLLEMDAYHHIEKDEEYPAVFLTAGLNDPRVPAWFSAKFMAKLQAYDMSSNPKSLLVDPESGHGIDDTKTKIFERFANIIAFAFKQTGHPEYQF